MKNPKILGRRDGRCDMNALVGYDGVYSVVPIYTAVEVSSTGEELMNALNDLFPVYNFFVDRETDEYVRLKSIYQGENEPRYFIAEK